MPTLYPCSVPGCPRMFKRVGKGTRCPTHAPYGWPTDRPKMSSTWSTTRKRKLEANPMCEATTGRFSCNTKAVTVDHIIARAFGGTDEWTNLMSLCDHHRRKKDHADRERGKGR